MRRHRMSTGLHRHLCWLIALVVLFAVFLIGVGQDEEITYLCQQTTRDRLTSQATIDPIAVVL